MAGEIALRSTEPDTLKAERYFERALEVARRQQAKSWELRAAMSLARVWRDQGRVQHARANCWLRSTAGSQKGSTRAICRDAVLMMAASARKNASALQKQLAS